MRTLIDFIVKLFFIVLPHPPKIKIAHKLLSASYSLVIVVMYTMFPITSFSYNGKLNYNITSINSVQVCYGIVIDDLKMLNPLD